MNGFFPAAGMLQQASTSAAPSDAAGGMALAEEVGLFADAGAIAGIAVSAAQFGFSAAIGTESLAWNQMIFSVPRAGGAANASSGHGAIYTEWEFLFVQIDASNSASFGVRYYSDGLSINAGITDIFSRVGITGSQKLSVAFSGIQVAGVKAPAFMISFAGSIYQGTADKLNPFLPESAECQFGGWVFLRPGDLTQASQANQGGYVPKEALGEGKITAGTGWHVEPKQPDHEWGRGLMFTIASHY